MTATAFAFSVPPSLPWRDERLDTPPEPDATGWLHIEDIRLHSAAADGDAALHLLASLLARRLTCPTQAVLRRLKAREAMGSTVMSQERACSSAPGGWAVALPHAQMPALSHAVAACVHLATPVRWAEGQARVQWAVALLLPLQDPERQLLHLATLAAACGDGVFRRLLAQARTPAAVWKLLHHAAS